MPLVAFTDAPDVVAIVPTLGEAPERLAACLASLTATAGRSRLAVVVVVNSSVERDLPTATGVHFAYAGLNLGWAGGLTFGARIASAPLLWFVQDDMVVRPETLGVLREALERDSGLGVVGPLVVGRDGLVKPGSCGGTVSEGVVNFWYPERPSLPSELTGLDDLDYLPSRGMLVRAAAYADTGGCNPALYPVQYADVDFCFRLRSTGYRFELVAAAPVEHGGSASTPSPFGHFLNSRNSRSFANKWFPEAPPESDRFFPVAEFRPDPVELSPLPLHPAMGDELLATVAQSASNTLTHLSRVFANQRAELDASLETTRRLAVERDHALIERERVVNSASWRLTAPLRAVLGLLRRLARVGRWVRGT